MSDAATAHLELADKLSAELRVLSVQLAEHTAVIQRAMDRGATPAELSPLENKVSEILGKIHQVGETAMNEYRVNRGVAKVERTWRAAFEKERNQ